MTNRRGTKRCKLT